MLVRPLRLRIDPAPIGRASLTAPATGEHPASTSPGPATRGAGSGLVRIARKTLGVLTVAVLLTDAGGRGHLDLAGAASPEIAPTTEGAPIPDRFVFDRPAIRDDESTTGWIEVADAGVRPADADSRPAASPTFAGLPYLDAAHLGCLGGGSDEPHFHAACSGSQTLDVYKASTASPNPVILWVHGGGWAGGDKIHLAEPVLRAHRQGFDIVAVNYRLTEGPQPAVFPAAVLDVKAAVRWIKANARAQGFDSRTIIAVGHSAGGHLVQMLATTAGVAGLEPTAGLSGVQARQTSRVTAVVSISAMSHLPTFLADGHAWSAGLTHAFLGCALDCDRATLERASATAHVTDDDAPIYAVTGAVDQLAYPHATDLLGDRYTRAGIGDRLFDDAVDTGTIDCRGHNPWCGANTDAFDRFLHAALGDSAGAAASTSHPAELTSG